MNSFVYSLTQDSFASGLTGSASMTRLDILAASIAHEVNQPLTGIMTNASTCLRMLSADPPNIAGALETAQRTIRDGQRAADVVYRLRSLFNAKTRPSEAVDLNEAVLEAIGIMFTDLERAQVILQMDLADTLTPIPGDRIQLQQVILNLLRNAVEAMSEASARKKRLIVKTERTPGGSVTLSVQDTGTGIDINTAEQLFQPFYTTKPTGMGIGLSVSYAIISKHHGRLWASPNDGPGATFSFSIPCLAQILAGTSDALFSGIVPEAA